MGSLQPYFSLYKFPAGRTLFSMREVSGLADKHKLAAVRALTQEAIEAAQQIAVVEQGWRRSRSTIAGQRKKAVPVDAAIDRMLGAISQHLNSMVHGFGDQGVGIRAASLLQRILPEGAGVITNMSYENELAAVEEILSELRGNSAEDVVVLGLSPFVERLAQLAEEFSKLLSVQTAREISYDQVREAQTKGQEALLRVVAKIIGDHSGSSSEETALRQELLAPILAQNQRIAESYSSRKSASDVDPETGEELPTEPPAQTGPGA